MPKRTTYREPYVRCCGTRRDHINF